jgi:hypothetical protein
MNFLERDLEDIIFNTENDLLRDRGLEIHGKKKRQVQLGNYGISDLITVERDYTNQYDIDEYLSKEKNSNIFYNYKEFYLKFTIYELKQNCIDNNAFLQAIKYVRGLSSYLQSHRNIEYKINIVLIGKQISLNDNVSYLPNIFLYDDCSVKIYTYIYNYDGISFNEINDYKLTNEGF